MLYLAAIFFVLLIASLVAPIFRNKKIIGEKSSELKQKEEEELERRSNLENVVETLVENKERERARTFNIRESLDFSKKDTSMQNGMA